MLSNNPARPFSCSQLRIFLCRTGTSPTLHTTSVAVHGIQGVIDRGDCDVSANGVVGYAEFVGEMAHRFVPTRHKNPHNLGSALICCHGQSPSFCQVCPYRRSQIGKVISYSKNFFQEVSRDVYSPRLSVYAKLRFSKLIKADKTRYKAKNPKLC